MSSNPTTVYWMDFFTFIWCKKCNVFLEKTKVNKEEAEDAYFFEKNYCLVYRNGSSLSLPLTAVALLAQRPLACITENA